MELNQQKKELSVAFARAVAAAAGFAVTEPSVDDDSIDIGFVSGSGLRRRPRIEAQLKCSADDPLRPADFSFRLSKKNHNDLCADALVPRILVVLRVPPKADHWLDLDEERLLVRYCAYWRSLASEKETQNATVTIRMRRDQILHPEALTAMMTRVQGGGMP